jgi:hypothetical protein
MKTLLEQLEEAAEEIRNGLQVLLLTHSSVSKHPPTPGIFYVDVTGDHRWGQLASEGAQVQNRLLGMHTEYANLLNMLCQDFPQQWRSQVMDRVDPVREKIEQHHSTWCKSTKQAFEEACAALDAQLDALRHVIGEQTGVPIFVPDTNALIQAPFLEKWHFDGVTQFEVVLLPTVLGELDKLKVEHRNQDVRDKATKLIAQLKEFRRRGRLGDGVAIVKGRVLLRSVAREPNFEQTLPWLQRENNDDRLLASFLDVLRQYPSSPVVLVTSDINLQNKAEAARLPFCEPPASGHP